MGSSGVMDVLNVELHNSFGEISVLRMTKNLTEEDGGFCRYFAKRNRNDVITKS